jgi:uncharacterized protein
MAASFLHGVEVVEIASGPVPITVLKSSVIGLVGTAPLWALGPGSETPTVNAPTLVNSAHDGAAFGPPVQGYTIPYALGAIQAQGVGQVIVVNVFDINEHTSDLVEFLAFSDAGAINLGHMGVANLTLLPTTMATVSAEPHTFAGAPPSVELIHANTPASTVVVTSDPAGTTYVQGTDYVVNTRDGLVTRVPEGNIGPTESVLTSYSYYSGVPYSATEDYSVDLVNGVVGLKPGGTIGPGATVIASFSYADPAKVQDSNVIGAVTGATYTGIQALMRPHTERWASFRSSSLHRGIRRIPASRPR